MVFGQHAMDGMAEFVCHSRNVSGFPCVVQHDIGCHAWNDAVAVGAAQFARACRGVDMSISKHLLR